MGKIPAEVIQSYLVWQKEWEYHGISKTPIDPSGLVSGSRFMGSCHSDALSRSGYVQITQD